MSFLLKDELDLATEDLGRALHEVEQLKQTNERLVQALRGLLALASPMGAIPVEMEAIRAAQAVLEDEVGL